MTGWLNELFLNQVLGVREALTTESLPKEDVEVCAVAHGHKRTPAALQLTGS